mmetsp:Transcript_27743/g.51641  ORF Transcript_27743/g.51641 Transcript_27743/m.51641 type:complete len:158 (-) Transcript_27743:236-709(-)
MLGFLGPKKDRRFMMGWRSEHDARTFLDTLLKPQVTSAWYWRHEFTSLVPESGGLGASRLSYFDFSEQCLVGMRFTGLNLFGSSFEHCDLRGVQFVDCVLCSSSFFGANLQGTCWNGSNLSNAIFDGANIAAADFRLANSTQVTQFTKAKSRSEALF